MPRLERVITLDPNEVLIVRSGPPVVLSREQEDERRGLLSIAAESIKKNSDALKRSWSGEFADLEHVQEALGSAFRRLYFRMNALGIERDELDQHLENALLSARGDVSTKKEIVASWNQQFDRFCENPPRSTSAHSHAA